MSMTFYATRVRLTSTGERCELLGGPDVNLANVNAAMVLRHLGFAEIASDPCGGAILAEQLRTRIREALATIKAVPGLDSATETTETVGAQGAVWIECGRREGYLEDTLRRLLEVAEFAGNEYVTVA